MENIFQAAQPENLLQMVHHRKVQSSFPDDTPFRRLNWPNRIATFVKLVCQEFFVFLFAAIDIDQLIENNVNACNGVLRATACAIQEIKLNRTCEVS